MEWPIPAILGGDSLWQHPPNGDKGGTFGMMRKKKAVSHSIYGNYVNAINSVKSTLSVP